MIKMITLQVLNSQSDETEQEDVDYFSQHIYQAPVVLLPPEPQQPPIQQSVAPTQTFQSSIESNTITQSSPPSHQSVEVSKQSETETNIESSAGFDQVDDTVSKENNSSTGLKSLPENI